MHGPIIKAVRTSGYTHDCEWQQVHVPLARTGSRCLSPWPMNNRLFSRTKARPFMYYAVYHNDNGARRV
jgi:hypothetical protein